jgi:hypothetical protein
MSKVEEGYVRPSKFGSKKIATTTLTAIEAHTVEFLGATVVAALTDDGVPSGTNALTWHGISGSQPAGEKILAKGKFTSITLTSGSVVVY